MKAIKLLKGGAIKYCWVPNLKLKKGFAIVKVSSAGLCGSDIQKILYDSKSRNLLKTEILGHEFSGIIEKIYPDRRFRKGDRVVVIPLIFDNTLSIINSKSLGKDFPGGFAEFCLVPIKNLRKIPKEISFDLASLADVVAVCIHAIKLGKIKKDSNILVIGDGAIGISMALVLKDFCKYVRLKGKNEKNLEIASKIGIKIFKDNKDYFNSFDFIFETVGRKQDSTLSEAINLISPKGKIIVLGVFEKYYANKIILRELFFKEACMIGSNNYNGLDDFNKALRLIQKYCNKFNKIITHRINLEDFNKALLLVKNRRETGVIKIIFKPQNYKNGRI